MAETTNMRVTKAGYKYIGHFRRGYLEIHLENHGSGVAIRPNDEYSLVDLFMCFDIDSENGNWLSDIVGRYCRVTFDECGKVKFIQHIINDKLCWENKDGDE